MKNLPLEKFQQYIQDDKYNIKASGHYEAGSYIHSSEYFFIKKLFSRTDIVHHLSKYFNDKLKLLGIVESENIMFIGYYSYLGVLLSNVCGKNEERFTYKIIEHLDNKLVWRTKYDSKDFIDKKIIIVLPIAATNSILFNLMSKIQSDFGIGLLGYHPTLQFISIFQVFPKDHENVLEFYKAFNWSSFKDGIIKVHKRDQCITGTFIVKLDNSGFEISHNCGLCFPESNGDKEKTDADFVEGSDTAHRMLKVFNATPLFPVNKYNESISIIERIPNYRRNSQESKWQETSNLRILTAEKFKEQFYFPENNAHLFGHIKSRKSSYLHYLRGHKFFNNNKTLVLPFFESEIEKIWNNEHQLTLKNGSNVLSAPDAIVFITSDTIHNSTFLEKFVLSDFFLNNPEIIVRILRYNNTIEFIDNFIQSNEEVLVSPFVKLTRSGLFGNSNSLDYAESDLVIKNPVIIYYEDIISAAQSFKLLSNYLKHYRRFNTISRHGFDYIFTMIDRTPVTTEMEILKKMLSNKNDNPGERFIKYCKLHAPIMATEHLGNPLENDISILRDMLASTNLDAVKSHILKEIQERRDKGIPEELSEDKFRELYPRKPYASIFRHVDPVNEVYGHIDIQYIDWIKLYVTHLINAYVESKETAEQFDLDILIGNILKDNENVQFFHPRIYGNGNKKNISPSQSAFENQFIIEIVIKTLAKHPFIHYKIIFEKVFKFCHENLLGIIHELRKPSDISFGKLYELFWRLKFYVKRLTEFNSPFIISESFLDFLKEFFNSKYAVLNREVDNEIDGMKNMGNAYISESIGYEKRQIYNFTTFLLFCYKRLTYNNYAFSIELERLAKKKRREIIENIKIVDRERVIDVLRDKYYDFIDLLIAINTFPFTQIKQIKGSQTTDKLIEVISSKYSEININFLKIFNDLNVGRQDLSAIDIKRIVSFIDWNEGIENKNLLNKKILKILERISANFENARPTVSLIYNYDRSKNKYYYIEHVGEGGQNNIAKFDIGEDVELTDDCFLYRFIDGIYYKERPQSYLVVARGKENEYFTFADNFDSNSRQEDLPFGSLFGAKLFEKQTTILGQYDLFICIRLSDIFGIESSGAEEIIGKGMLLVSLDLRGDWGSYFDIISISSIRNLIHLRVDILEYLRSDFDGDMFLEVVRKLEESNFKNTFTHGVEKLLNSAIAIIANGHDRWRSAQYVLRKISRQLYQDLSIIEKKAIIEIRREEILDLLYLYLCDLAINDDLILSEYCRIHIEIENDRKSFFVQRDIFDVVMNEIFYNIRKRNRRKKYINAVYVETDHCPMVYVGIHSKEIRIVNSYNEKIDTTFKKKNGGLELCADVLARLDLPELQITYCDIDGDLKRRCHDYFSLIDISACKFVETIIIVDTVIVN
jgi:hypothetical protein